MTYGAKRDKSCGRIYPHTNFYTIERSGEKNEIEFFNYPEMLLLEVGVGIQFTQTE